MKIDFNSTTQLVKSILEDHPDARCSDSALYIRVCRAILPEVDRMPFCYVLANRKALNLPCFETVRRTRQKIQQKNQELAASEKVKGYRAELEEQYRDFAMNN